MKKNNIKTNNETKNTNKGNEKMNTKFDELYKEVMLGYKYNNTEIEDGFVVLSNVIVGGNVIGIGSTLAIFGSSLKVMDAALAAGTFTTIPSTLTTSVTIGAFGTLGLGYIAGACLSIHVLRQIRKARNYKAIEEYTNCIEKLRELENMTTDSVKLKKIAEMIDEYETLKGALEYDLSGKPQSRYNKVIYAVHTAIYKTVTFPVKLTYKIAKTIVMLPVKAVVAVGKGIATICKGIVKLFSRKPKAEATA